jgi:hypothetical protein
MAREEIGQYFERRSLEYQKRMDEALQADDGTLAGIVDEYSEFLCSSARDMQRRARAAQLMSKVYPSFKDSFDRAAKKLMEYSNSIMTVYASVQFKQDIGNLPSNLPSIPIGTDTPNGLEWLEGMNLSED